MGSFREILGTSSACVPAFRSVFIEPENVLKEQCDACLFPDTVLLTETIRRDIFVLSHLFHLPTSEVYKE